MKRRFFCKLFLSVTSCIFLSSSCVSFTGTNNVLTQKEKEELIAKYLQTAEGRAKLNIAMQVFPR